MSHWTRNLEDFTIPFIILGLMILFSLGIIGSVGLTSVIVNAELSTADKLSSIAGGLTGLLFAGLIPTTLLSMAAMDIYQTYRKFSK